MPREQGRKVVASNRKAYHDYFIEERYEAGIALEEPRPDGWRSTCSGWGRRSCSCS